MMQGRRRNKTHAREGGRCDSAVFWGGGGDVVSAGAKMIRFGRDRNREGRVVRER